MEEKLPDTSKYRNTGEHKTKERNRLPYNILQSFLFPSSQGSVGSISSADQMPEQDCRCQDNGQLLTKQKLFGTWSLIITG